MAEALPQLENIEEMNAKDSSSKLEEYFCSSLDKGAKVKWFLAFFSFLIHTRLTFGIRYGQALNWTSFT